MNLHIKSVNSGVALFDTDQKNIEDCRMIGNIRHHSDAWGIVNACNEHDRLVAENADLREKLSHKDDVANQCINAALSMPAAALEEKCALLAASLKHADAIRDRLKLSMQDLLEYVRDTTDCGPLEFGYKSDELIYSIYAAENALKAAGSNG